MDSGFFCAVNDVKMSESESCKIKFSAVMTHDISTHSNNRLYILNCGTKIHLVRSVVVLKYRVVMQVQEEIQL